MSLQVWLPLNGNINNQGVDFSAVITCSNPQYTTGGKLCNKYFTSSSDISVTSNVLKSSKVWSYCYWGYIKSSLVTSNWTKISHISDGGDCLRTEVCPSSYGNGIYCYSVHNNAANKITNNASSSPAGGYYDQWAHFCLTSDGATITKYMNGIKINTLPYNGTGAITGTFVFSNSNIIHKQDIRIYDHCLSPKEVKEISKGLFLHYKLGGNDGYFGGRNLAIGTLTAEINSHWKTNGWTPSFTTYSKEERIYKLVATNGWVVARYILDSSYAKKNITLSFKAKKVSKETTATEDSRIFYSNATGTNPYLTDHFDIANKADTWFDLSITVKLNDDHQIGIGVRCSPENKILKTTWLIKDIKIEESDKPTAWTPAPEDNPALYDTTLYDTSGYLSTAIPSGTIGYSSDSPRYDGSYIFSDTSHFKLTQPLVSPSQFTCSFWVKPTSLGGYAIITSNYNNPSSGFWIAVNCEGSGLWFYNGGYARSNKGLLSANTWYHCCLTFKNGVFTWYQNGENAGSTDLSSKSKTLSIASTIGIGNNYTGTQWNTKFNGSISDFRMYATALSASDVKELYNAPISITNTGVLMTQGEFKEV